MTGRTSMWPLLVYHPNVPIPLTHLQPGGMAGTAGILNMDLQAGPAVVTVRGAW